MPVKVKVEKPEHNETDHINQLKCQIDWLILIFLIYPVGVVNISESCANYFSILKWTYFFILEVVLPWKIHLLYSDKNLQFLSKKLISIFLIQPTVRETIADGKMPALLRKQKENSNLWPHMLPRLFLVNFEAIVLFNSVNKIVILLWPDF